MCLNFWYHMYGTHIRTLNVYLKSRGSLGTPVWSRTGTRSNQWYSASVDVQGSAGYQIVFEGVRGTSYRGDIALDDITVSMGSCSGMVNLLLLLSLLLLLLLERIARRGCKG